MLSFLFIAQSHQSLRLVDFALVHGSHIYPFLANNTASIRTEVSSFGLLSESPRRSLRLWPLSPIVYFEMLSQVSVFFFFNNVFVIITTLIVNSRSISSFSVLAVCNGDHAKAPNPTIFYLVPCICLTLC